MLPDLWSAADPAWRQRQKVYFIDDDAAKTYTFFADRTTKRYTFFEAQAAGADRNETEAVSGVRRPPGRMGWRVNLYHVLDLILD